MSYPKINAQTYDDQIQQSSKQDSTEVIPFDSSGANSPLLAIKKSAIAHNFVCYLSPNFQIWNFESSLKFEYKRYQRLMYSWTDSRYYVGDQP